jgi:ubiquinone/menaquinone biosynthesis C-methylase UbiE
MGFDIDANMISYATTQAQVGKLEHASFRVMNALDPLDYPDNFFDLVSARFLAAVGRSAWPQLIPELFRVTRLGGFIRLTEVEDCSVTTSPAFERLGEITLQAWRKGSISFSPTGRSMGHPPMLPSFLRKAGYQNIQERALIIDWSEGTEVHAAMAQELKIFFHLLQPFIVDIGAATEEELEPLYRDIDLELQAEDFCAFWTFFIVWGQKTHP